MKTLETLEIIGGIASLPFIAYGLYNLTNKYINWAEKNNFYDKEEEIDEELTD